MPPLYFSLLVRLDRVVALPVRDLPIDHVPEGADPLTVLDLAHEAKLIVEMCPNGPIKLDSGLRTAYGPHTGPDG